MNFFLSCYYLRLYFFLSLVTFFFSFLPTIQVLHFIVIIHPLIIFLNFPLLALYSASSFQLLYLIFFYISTHITPFLISFAYSSHPLDSFFPSSPPLLLTTSVAPPTSLSPPLMSHLLVPSYAPVFLLHSSSSS